jgi:hypothetical protein
MILGSGSRTIALESNVTRRDLAGVTSAGEREKEGEVTARN